MSLDFNDIVNLLEEGSPYHLRSAVIYELTQLASKGDVSAQHKVCELAQVERGKEERRIIYACLLSLESPEAWGALKSFSEEEKGAFFRKKFHKKTGFLRRYS